MEKIWRELYKIAKTKIRAKEIKPFIEYGTSACAILSSKGNIYSGISVVSTTNLNVSAEKSAILEMLNNGEDKISKLLVINELEEVILPSLECLDYLKAFLIDGNVEILKNLEGEVVSYSDILPDWWGTYRNEK